jgi:low affinity Fe/Cu permease
LLWLKIYSERVMNEEKNEIKHKKNYFERLSNVITNATGTPTAFLIALVIVIIWAATGPIFNYSDTWQLVINTGTTIVTFLMVFLIQQSQNKDTVAVHLKLNELLASNAQADNKLVNAEELTGAELKLLKKLYARMNANDGVEPISDTPAKISEMLKDEEEKTLEIDNK